MPAQVLLTGAALRAYRRLHPLAAAMPTCRELLEPVVREGRGMFALGEADGLLLWVEGDPDARTLIRPVNFIEGALWPRSQASAQLAGSQPVGMPPEVITVDGTVGRYRIWWTAAPIWDPESTLQVGLIHLTGHREVPTPIVCALVRAMARAVGSELARGLLYGELVARNSTRTWARAAAAQSAVHRAQVTWHRPPDDIAGAE